MNPAIHTPLSTVLDLARARTVVLRDVDAAIGVHHGIGLSDLALLLELKAAPQHRMRRVLALDEHPLPHPVEADEHLLHAHDSKCGSMRFLPGIPRDLRP